MSKDEYRSIEKIAEEYEPAIEIPIVTHFPEVMTDGKGNSTLDNYVKSEEE